MTTPMQPAPGGIYALRCEQNGAKLLCACVDFAAAKAQFEACQRENRVPHPFLQTDWQRYGVQAFVFEIVEQVAKQPQETGQAYLQRLEALKQWMDMQAFGCC